MFYFKVRIELIVSQERARYNTAFKEDNCV